MMAKEGNVKKNLPQQNPNIQYVLLPASTNLQALRAQLLQLTSNSQSSAQTITTRAQQAYSSCQNTADIDSSTVTGTVLPSNSDALLGNVKSLQHNISQNEKTDHFANVSSHQLGEFINVITPSISQHHTHYELTTVSNNISARNVNFSNASTLANTCPAQNDNNPSQKIVSTIRVLSSNTANGSDLQDVEKSAEEDSYEHTTDEVCNLDNYPTMLMNKLDIFRKQHKFCDLTIQIGEVKLNCHSVVVSTMSSLLHDLLLTKASEKMRQVLIVLPSVLNVQAFSELLDALYTGQIRLKKNNVKQILQICAYLKIFSIQTKCEEYCNTVFGNCTDELNKICTDAQKMVPPSVNLNEVDSEYMANESVLSDCLEVESEIMHGVENNITRNSLAEPTSPCLAMSDQTKPRSSLTNLVRVASEAFKDLDQENQVSCEEDGGEIETESSQSANDEMGDDKIKDNKWCNKCEKQFTSNKRFFNHMKLAHSGNRHKCSFCLKTFKKTSDKVLHERRVHTKEKPLKCKTCGMSFCLKRELNHHMKLHDGKDQSCPICRKIFRSEDGLKHHIAAHGEKKYICRNSTCQRAFPTIMLRNRHERSHSSAKPFVCDKCGYSFKLNYELTRHKLKHSGEKRFKCVKCSRSFGRAEHLKGHMLSHSDARNFKCDICNKTFKQKSGLSVHKRKHDAPFNYVCDVCGYKCHSKSNLQLHSVTHVNERPFQCNICSAFFKAKKYLSRHLKIHEKKGETTAEKYNELKNVKKSNFFDDTTKLKNSQVIYPKSHQVGKGQRKILPKVFDISSNQKLIQSSSYYISQSVFPPSATVLPSLQEAFRAGARTNLNVGQEQGVTARLIRMPLQFSNNAVIRQGLQSGDVYDKNVSGGSNYQRITNWQYQTQATASGSSMQLPQEDIPVLSVDDFLP